MISSNRNRLAPAAALSLFVLAGCVERDTPGIWSALDIPLADFALTAPWDHIGQLVLSTDDARTVFVDNVDFHK